MPEQPRRVLEKSRTVRRRYQRSNKRLQFTASQIERIERQQERERQAKNLREREKKRIANKKKRAEKEAKRREERKRLGLPDPDALKVPASQPLLLSFLTANKKTPQALNQESGSEEKDLSHQSGGFETESETDMEHRFVGSANGDAVDNETQSHMEYGDFEDFNSSGDDDGASVFNQEGLNIVQAGMVNHEEKMNGQTMNNETKESQTTLQESTRSVLSLECGFDKDTTGLPQEFCPDMNAPIGKETSNNNRVGITAEPAEATMAAQPTTMTFPSKLQSIHKNYRSEDYSIFLLESQSSASVNPIADRSPQNMTQSRLPSPVEIYQDPEDVLATICTQDLVDENDDLDDDKENLHPNIPSGTIRTPLARSGFLSPAETDTERKPLMPLNNATPSTLDDIFKFSSSKPGKLQLSSPGHETTALNPNVGIPTMSEAISDDEFSDLDLSLEELHELNA